MALPILIYESKTWVLSKRPQRSVREEDLAKVPTAPYIREDDCGDATIMN